MERVGKRKRKRTGSKVEHAPVGRTDKMKSMDLYLEGGNGRRATGPLKADGRIRRTGH